MGNDFFAKQTNYSSPISLPTPLSRKPICSISPKSPKLETVRGKGNPWIIQGRSLHDPQRCEQAPTALAKHRGENQMKKPAKRLRSTFLQLEELEPRLAPTGSLGTEESLDTMTPGSLPVGWSQWSSTGANAFAVSSAQSLSPPNSLAISSPTVSSMNARAWVNIAQPANETVSAAVYLNSLIPIEILDRGTNLNTTTPSYYAVSVTQGLDLKLLKVTNGTITTLGEIKSANWIANQWVNVTLYTNGNTVEAQVQNGAGQYLNSSGHWQSSQTWALNQTDTSISGGGAAGIGRLNSYVGTVYVDNFSCAPIGTEESFDTTAPGSLPAGWSQWSTGTNAFAVSSAQSLSPSNSLAVNTPVSSTNARAWINTAQPANEAVSAAVYVNSLVPVEILDRGSNLNTPTPSYYAVSVTQGLDLKLLKVVNSAVTTLGEIKSANWITNQWINVMLFTNGDNLRAQVQNSAGQYLNSFGQWQSSPAWALNLIDASISSSGEVGVGRLPSYADTVYIDNFYYVPVAMEDQPPTVTINTPAAGLTLSGVAPVQVTATDDTSVTRVEIYVDNVLRAVETAASFTWNFDTTTIANGTHTLTVKAYDPAQNIGQASLTFTTQNNFAPLPQPHISLNPVGANLADLAYNGGSPQLSASTIALLENGVVDLVVSDPIYASQIAAIAPNLPQLLYTNVSSVYQSSLLAWDNYADSHGVPREEAFYHVSQATPYSSNGAGSTQPVDWFWGVYVGGPTLSNLTWQAHAGGSIPFGSVGQAVYIGFPEQFWEINLALASAAKNGWAGILEYPTAVDSSGNPTTWAPLTTLSNSTAGFTQSGQITFNPPADWVTASIGGSPRMYYVRILTTNAGTAPVANTILGDDYTHSNGTNSGVIPAYDWALNPTGGYLDPQEYALAAAAGYTAHFGYQSRLFSYGPMRFATNPGDAAFRAWAIQFEIQNLSANPWAAGLFMDNSTGVAPAKPNNVVEPLSTYSTDYATLLYEIGRALAPKWILANTSGGGSNANPTVQMVQGYFEEFGIRALAQNYQQFENLAALVATRSTLASPSPFAVLDSTPQGGAPTDPRTEMATLAYYYLLANPGTTFLDYDGGYDTTGPWGQHWFPAMNINLGQPLGNWSLFASGADPANPSLTYHIYQRSFANALVLYKPLSYGNGVTGVTTDNTATPVTLDGTYYPLEANGTLGAPVAAVTLRNGEGAILIKASVVPTSFVISSSTTSTTAGTALQVTVAAVNSAGQVVPGFTGTVHFTSTDGSAILPADYTFTAADNGSHTFNVTFKTAGSQTLTVSDPYSGIIGTLANVTVTPAAVSQFRITAPASVTALTPFTITITALDPYGNQVVNYTGTIHFSSSDALALLPANYTFTAADSGQHTFSSVVLWQTGTQTVTVTDTQTETVGSTIILVKKWSDLPWTEWVFGT
jgi:hypothetical protein